MPIYNNPAMGQAFENIAGLFAPPSAQDTAAYAMARLRNEQAARAQQVYDYAKDPNYDQAMADRLGVLSGMYSPNQSYYAVDQGNAVTMRGQDISSADNRYGTDRSYEASRLNNRDNNTVTMRGQDIGSADNRYGTDRSFDASRMNNMDNNDRALQEAIMRENGAMARQLAQPISVNQDQRVFLPGQTAAATGLAPMLEGARSPLSETQVAGMNTQRLIESGKISDEMLVDNILGDNTPVQIVGPDGNPQFASPGAAVRDGAQPFINRGAEAAPVLRNYEAPDGASGSARYDTQSKTWVDANTNAALPAGTRTYTGQLAGNSSETGFGTQRANLTKATDLEASLDGAMFQVQQMKEILNKNANVAGVPGRIKGVLQSLQSSAQQVVGAYAQVAPDAMMSLQEAQQMAAEVAPIGSYDPDIVRLQSGVFDLAYRRAQISNPGGEVSRQAFERALESFGQSVLSSQQDMAVALDAFERDTIGAGRVQVNSLRGVRNDFTPSGSAPSASAAPAASAEPAAGVPEGVDAELWNMMTPEERQLWQ